MVFVDVKKKKKKNTCQITNYRNYSLCRTNATPLSSPAYLFPNTPFTPPPRLLIFGFSSLAQKKFEKTYLSIRNSRTSNEIDFFECFGFNVIFK